MPKKIFDLIIIYEPFLPEDLCNKDSRTESRSFRHEFQLPFCQPISKVLTKAKQVLELDVNGDDKHRDKMVITSILLQPEKEGDLPEVIFDKLFS